MSAHHEIDVGGPSASRGWSRPQADAASTEERDSPRVAAGSGVAGELTLSPGRVAWGLAGAILCLQLASFAGEYARVVLGHDYVFGLVRLFDVNAEANAPTWFSVVLLLACAAMLAIIASSVRRAGHVYATHWRVLALGFALLSLDEAAQIHDIVSEVVNAHHVVLPVAFQFAWVIPAIVVVAAVLVSYVRFLRHLPTRTSLLFLVSGAIYVGGAVGMEMVGWVVSAHVGWNTLTARAVVAVEETGEMAGAALFLYALLDFQARYFGRFTLRFGR